MNDVLEHFPDPFAALTKAYEILNEQGIIFIQLPNIGSKQFKRLREHWPFLIPPDHTFHFTVESLKLLTKKTRFQYLWHRTVNSIEDFLIFRAFSPSLRDKVLFMIHHNPWYWPRFYGARNNAGSLIQMIITR
jgi:hypothetical protein